MPPTSWHQSRVQPAAHLRKLVPAACLIVELPILPWKSSPNLQRAASVAWSLSEESRSNPAPVPLHWSVPHVQHARPASDAATACTRRSQRTPRPACSHPGSGTTRSSAQPIRITDDPALEAWFRQVGGGLSRNSVP